MAAFSSPESWVRIALGRFVPERALGDEEMERRARLFVAFSLLGLVFGLLFSGFYLCIDHPWGAAIILACSAALAGAPWIVRAGGVETAGNIYALVLVLGFSGLTAIEGGLHGHAVAWLAVVPLCACILVGQQTCRLWCGVCLAAMAGFCALDFAGVHLPRLYPPQWESAITAAGYLSLTVFMSLLGVLFENGRRRALEKLQRALDALSAANARLHHLDQERSEFLGIAAHDLRNPLNAIVGFAQLAREFCPGGDELQQTAMLQILKSSADMSALLDRLLSVRAIEEGALELTAAPCDLEALAAAAARSHLSAAAAKGIALDYAPPAAPAWVMADALALSQALDNLLSNAIKFSPPGRPVALRVLPPGGDRRIRVEVQDAGPGLSEEDQGKLYGKFTRLSARPTAGESSHGLGLSIVKRLVEAMGGELGCRSKLGEGATFSVSMAACAPPPDQELDFRRPAASDEAELLPAPVAALGAGSRC